jgi:hypothetical protein
MPFEEKAVFLIAVKPNLSIIEFALQYTSKLLMIVNVHPEIVDVGSGQGRSEFETPGVAFYVEDFK